VWIVSKEQSDLSFVDAPRIVEREGWMTAPWEILVIASDLDRRRALAKTLTAQGLDSICVATICESLAMLADETVGLVFCDTQLSDGTYRDLLAALHALKVKTRVVVTSRHADWDEFLEAVHLGAFDVIPTPCRPTDVEWMVIQAKRDERSRPRPEVQGESLPTSYRQRVAAQDA
jgi:DNA-binding NtrC family response regulator